MNSKLFKRVAKTAALSTLAAAPQICSTAQESVPKPVLTVSTPALVPAVAAVGDALVRRRVREEPTAWTSSMQKQFLKLSEQEAFGKISPEELADLEFLAGVRRELLNPRTIEEIMWSRKQEQLTEELVRALGEYVHFHGSAS